MIAFGRWTALLLLLFVGVVGCRTSQPDLKPAKTAEVFTAPPDNYDSRYPKQAFAKDDMSTRLASQQNQAGMSPARGMMPGGGMGGAGMGAMNNGMGGMAGAPR